MNTQLQLVSVVVIIISILFICIFDVVVDASSFNEPHSHRGIVTPFQPGDPKVHLDNKAKDILSQGKPYQV